MVLRFLLTQINTRLFGRKILFAMMILNRQKAKKLLKEIKESIVNIDFADDLTVDQLDEICARLEQRIEYLNEKVEETKKISPNPAKQERRTAKKYLKQTRERKQKNSKYAEQFAIVGERNSYF